MSHMEFTKALSAATSPASKHGNIALLSDMFSQKTENEGYMIVTLIHNYLAMSRRY